MKAFCTPFPNLQNSWKKKKERKVEVGTLSLLLGPCPCVEGICSKRICHKVQRDSQGIITRYVMEWTRNTFLRKLATSFGNSQPMQNLISPGLGLSLGDS